MAFNFDTTEYQFSHGQPRGRGSWAFAFDGNEDMNAMFWTPGSTTFVEAKRMAKAEAKRRGATWAKVMP